MKEVGASGELLGTNKELLGMTAQALYLILIERGREAGVSHFSPHDFRRTFAPLLGTFWTEGRTSLRFRSWRAMPM